jgi:beta-galactosidase
MKTLIIRGLFVMDLILISSFHINSQSKPDSFVKSNRIEKSINSHWTFNYFPEKDKNTGYENPGFDDSSWPVISLPHTWGTYETTGDLHPFIRNNSEVDNPFWWTGWGWYRKHFSINKSGTGRKVFIEFEGVQKYCKVWINGKYLGDHKGSYGSFDFDITDKIVEGDDNIIVVSVNNQQNDNFRIPPMTAVDFNVYGGIPRSVNIVLKDKLYIPMQGSASHEGGTFVTTPRVSEKEGIVRVQTWVKNDYPRQKECILKTYILDGANTIIQVLKSEFSINPGQLYRFDQTFKPVKNPHLWSPDDPYLYKVYSEVIEGKNVADNYITPLGFRWFRWDYKENFLYVNNKKIVIHGGNLLQEYPWLGDAIPEWITANDIKDIADNLNYNFMRTPHYPNNRIVYALADKYGIMIDEEAPNVVNQSFSPDVQEQQLKEMIRRDRNHPSIMFWSIGNKSGSAVVSKIALAEDTTRIIIAGEISGNSAAVSVNHKNENLAIKSLSRSTIRGWYNRDVKDMEPTDNQSSGTEEYNQGMLKESGLLGTGNLCAWIYADHGTTLEFLNSPLLNINPEGYVDIYRVPKYTYYLWQATYSKKPMIFIQPHYWRSDYIGQKKDIVVNSNCDKVELRINGRTVGIQIPDDSNFHTVTFKDIQIERGTITATGELKGAKVISRLDMAGEPERIILSPSHTKIDADRSSVIIVSADIADSRGIHVYGARNPLRWKISGPATPVGPDVYESDINKFQQQDGTGYMDVPVSNVLRSTGKPGKIKITVSANGLASGSVEIEAEAPKPDNSVITELVPDDAGRKPVARVNLNFYRLDEVPQELKLTNNDINLGPSDKPGYLKLMREILMKNNPVTDTVSIEFKALVDLLSVHLVNNKGQLAAADYNFSITGFNNCRLISGYVNSTKLPPSFKEGLRRYYADMIIRQGIEKNASDEMNWLNWIPSGGTVVISREVGNISDSKGTIITGKRELLDLIAVVYPVFVNFTKEAKERALTFISKMNPYIRAEYKSEPGGDGASDKITTVRYSVEKEQPILIPLLKFISE